jgi:hypothetical protein
VPPGLSRDWKRGDYAMGRAASARSSVKRERSRVDPGQGEYLSRIDPPARGQVAQSPRQGTGPRRNGAKFHDQFNGASLAPLRPCATRPIASDYPNTGMKKARTRVPPGARERQLGEPVYLARTLRTPPTPSWVRLREAPAALGAGAFQSYSCTV